MQVGRKDKEKEEEIELDQRYVAGSRCSSEQMREPLVSSHHLVLLLHLGDLLAVHLVDLFELRQHSFAALSQHLFIADQLIGGETVQVR